jgi:two-component system phosphate regulon sensor histidine kinase PhoR
LGNGEELQGAFSNLIRNAIQHTDTGDRIRVSWQDTAGRPTLLVQDSGRGIAPEHLPRLTECFYRVDEGRSRESGGTGLGLALVELVVSRHQGQLLVDSVVGGGSLFTCRFPAASAVRRPGACTPETGAPGEGAVGSLSPPQAGPERSRSPDPAAPFPA